MTRLKMAIACLLLLIPLSALAAPPADVRVTPRWVKNAMSVAGSDWIVLEASWGGEEAKYLNGHLPGAIHVNTDEIEYDLFFARTGTDPKKLGRSTTPEQDAAKGLSSTDTLPRNFWGLYPDRYLLPALAHMGIDRHSRVIVASSDLLAASRLTWVLLYAGVADVRLLDGGLDAWKRAGYPVHTDSVARTPKKAFGRTTPLHPEYKVRVNGVRKALSDGTPRIADVRTRPEHDGASAPYSYIPTRGRIPDSIWVGSGTNPWNVKDYQQKDGRFKEPQTVMADWAAKGLEKKDGTIFYCGSGWRSSASFLLARAAGWRGIRNMDAGWMEWSMGEEKDRNPVVSGPE